MLLLTLVSLIISLVYPAYATYKTLSQRPASEHNLERWLMYWSVTAVIMAIESLAEWTVSWIPFYSLFKTALLCWLALPQTQGSTYIYQTYLQPLLVEHEPTIDYYLSEYKAHFYAFLQAKLRLLWEQATKIIARQTGVNLNAQDPDAVPAEHPVNNANRRHSMGGVGEAMGGSNSTAQVVLGLWKTWGPTVVGALQPIQERAQRAAAEAAAASATRSVRSHFAVDVSSNVNDRPAPPTHSALSDTNSVLERKRRLQAELAALEALSEAPVERQITPTPLRSHVASSPNAAIDQSVYLSDSASDTGSLETGVPQGRYEEISRDDASDGDESGVGHATGGARPTSWWRWSRGSEYGHLHTE